MKDKEWASSFSHVFEYIYNFAVDLLGEAAFPWMSGTLLGVATGVFLHKLQISAKAALSKTEKQFNKLESLSTDVLVRLHNSRSLSSLREPSDGLQATVKRLFSELEKLRVVTPNLNPSNSKQDNARDIVRAYIDYIRPFLEDRDIATLRIRAKEWRDHHS
ncbi:hypothetical protein OAN307_c08630 [Octadecabacter antarcticus 307]|uniref:Uncharacterized protein n=1 Tax=Octadecabacter antarcticus 307 TaxID=391626 RepID=M9R1T0_9RHOB|nr:hypothetical protein [Octadecabacter antarcticus]AGI66584.1 hypothetical protein OAN307_c08630 [Octadecabacter antarcticus 307]